MNVNDQLIKRIHQKIIGGDNDDFYSENDNDHIFTKCKVCINNMFPNVNDIENEIAETLTDNENDDSELWEEPWGEDIYRP